MKSKLLYIELKNGHTDDGPAWIGMADLSKSGHTIYFNNRALKKQTAGLVSGNHFDIETGEEYWVSGVKKNGQDRHYAGRGKILIDRVCIQEYLNLVGLQVIDENYFEIFDMPETDKHRFDAMENSLNSKLKS